MIEHYKANYNTYNEIIVGLPEFDSGEVISSYRDKGRHRMPHVYDVSEDGLRSVSISGAYKNGYTLSPYLSKALFK